MFLNSFFSIKQYILGLRKNRTFLKSKYTRTRQWSKSIVYFGLWFNLISIYLTFLYCYQFYFNLLEYWWLWYIIILLFFIRLFLNSRTYNFFFKVSQLFSTYDMLFRTVFMYFTKIYRLHYFYSWVHAEITTYYCFFLLKKKKQ